MAFVVKEVTNKDEWESFVLSRSEANFLQSWMWADVVAELGKKAYRIGYYDDDSLVGVMVAVVEPAKRGRYIAVAAGPILDWKSTKLALAWKQSIVELAQKEKCVFVRVRPQLVDSDNARGIFKELGFSKAKMHLEAELTSQLSLDVPADELMKNMRKNTRYELKQAKKRGIVISSTDDPKAISDFYTMQLQTARRHGFVPFSLERLQSEFDVFAKTGNVLLYSAHTKDGDLIAQAFIVFYGEEASYHYGASTELGRKEPGAYLLQWTAIKEAINRGCTRYNFWGVVHPEDTGHRFYGVSVFKRGFRGEDVQYVPAHDLVLQKLPYLKNFAIESIRKKTRKL